MSKKIFIAATGQDCGKTTTSLSLIHLARKKYKRVGFIKPFGPKLISYKGRQIDMDAALIALEEFDPELVRIVELRFYSGCTTEEIAGTLGHSPRTIKRRWRFARAWLQNHMQEDGS